MLEAGNRKFPHPLLFYAWTSRADSGTWKFSPLYIHRAKAGSRKPEIGNCPQPQNGCTVLELWKPRVPLYATRGHLHPIHAACERCHARWGLKSYTELKDYTKLFETCTAHTARAVGSQLTPHAHPCNLYTYKNRVSSVSLSSWELVKGVNFSKSPHAPPPLPLTANWDFSHSGCS